MLFVISLSAFSKKGYIHMDCNRTWLKLGLIPFGKLHSITMANNKPTHTWPIWSIGYFLCVFVLLAMKNGLKCPNMKIQSGWIFWYIIFTVCPSNNTQYTNENHGCTGTEWIPENYKTTYWFFGSLVEIRQPWMSIWILWWNLFPLFL